MSKRTLPSWRTPDPPERPVLKLYNSFTRKKETFVPQCGNHVQWYSCGPTVYDATHMGHARTYISFDILRRILSDYFGYQVHYVMNITDIDDKIIKRARQNYLHEKYLGNNKSLEQTLKDADSVLNLYEAIVNKTTDPDKKTMMQGMLEKVATAVVDLKAAVKSGDESKIASARSQLLTSAKDPFAEWLDSQYGATVTDNDIFTALPRYWEAEFHKDMKALNVLPPDVLTRVSEYVPEIVTYIERIVANGLAYESNGSVYFDVGAFDTRPQHYYARLVPEAYGDTRSLQEGEGDLSGETGDKRSANDFALWKRSKPGEPAWPSPWGAGRPGWHIECSAMASAVCGDKLDVHAGGVDLKFPHHDNELAQSEAYFDQPGWVNYFLHTGHLTIAGCKMSKSLKNFITIREALSRHTAAQLRLAFLLHSWKDTLDYSDNTMDMAVHTERHFAEFQLTVKDAIRVGRGAGEGGSWGPHEAQLRAKLDAAQDQVHLSLCDNIDTRSALDALRGLTGATHAYLRDVPAAEASAPLLGAAAGYVCRMLRVFGVACDTEGAGHHTDVMPYLEALATFRTQVRDAARTAGATEVLSLCDKLRDQVLPDLGVRLEDTGDRTVVKVVGAEAIRREREATARAAAAKEARKLELAAAQRARDEARRVNPKDMFRDQTDKYSAFDEHGVPTHDNEGKELSKGQVKKLQKLQAAQQKKYEDYLAERAPTA